MKKLKLTQAFTLIELMTVMAIILIIASLIVGVGKSARDAAKKRKAEVMIGTLEVAISMYRADTNVYPGDNDGSGCDDLYDELIIGTDFTGGSPWYGPYMEFKSNDLTGTTPEEIKDPWGNVYHYNSIGGASDPTHNDQSFDLWSEGPNGEDNAGGDDDITNW